MIKKFKKERAALDRLADFLVDDILNLSDGDVLAEFKEVYGEPDENAASMRAIFERTILVSNKERLAAAKAGVVETRGPLISATATPIDMHALRVRLRTLIDTPGFGPTLTLAARKEGELSDMDILGIFEDLHELGILPPDHENDDD
jgi:hypothetical protein